MKIFENGIVISKGISIAKILVIKSNKTKIKKSFITDDEIEGTLHEFEIAKEKASKEIEKTYQQILKKDEEQASIFLAHQEILRDINLEKEIKRLIIEEKYDIDYAIKTAFDGFADILRNSNNKIISERVADLMDVRDLLYRKISDLEHFDLNKITEPCIVLCNEILPSDLARSNKKCIKGIICEEGSNTSHVAIMARSYGIPTIFNIKGIIKKAKVNQIGIIDAINSRVILDPDYETLEAYHTLEENYMQEKKETNKYLKVESITKDNHKVGVFLNVGPLSDEDELLEYVDGIGLFRTEYIYMNKDTPPTEEEQFCIYREVLSKFRNKPVVIRTFDIGDDKRVSYLGNEKRTGMNYLDLFLTQIKALLRASIYGNLKIMIPMLDTVDDVRKAKKYISDTKDMLTNQGIEANYQFGVMIETPNLANQANEVVHLVDFASIGTNDLYYLIVGENRFSSKNTDVSENVSLDFLKTIKNISDVFHNERRELSVCGEYASNIQGCKVLLGLGIKNLSMSASRVSKIKKVLIKENTETLKKVVEEALLCATNDEMKAILNKRCKQNVNL